MSRKHITDYKKGEVVDTSSLLPEYSRSRLWNGISNNILNRFLTKKNFEEVTGYVGKEIDNSVLSRISEGREYLQKNQLQEVISATLGAETKFLTFEKFLKNLERDGVDLESFGEWGKALQFNFLPPVNIDKIINYQDYYWTDRNTTPNYITVEVQRTRSEAKYDELKKGVFSDIITSNPTTNLDSESAGIFIVHDVEQNIYVAVVKETDGSYLSLDGWTLNLTSFNEYVRLDREIVSLENTELRVSGSFLTGAREGFILSLYTDLDGIQEFVEVQSYEFDEDNNESVFTLKTVPQTSPTRVSVHAYAYAARSESIYFQDVAEPQQVDEINIYDLGEPVWYDRREVFSSNGGFVLSLGENEVIQYFGGPASELVVGAEYGIKINSGPNTGDHDLSSWVEGAVFGDPDRFLVDGVEFFKDENISYQIYVKDSLSANVYAQENDFFFDTTTDILYQWIDGQWKTKVRSFSILYESENSKLRADSNDWADENKWVHKNQITNLSESRQATQPIIEYKNYIELSYFSKFEFEWAYRKTVEDQYKKVEDQPNLLEIRPIKIEESDSENVPVFQLASNELLLPARFGNMESVLTKGDNINLVGFNTNDGQYTIDSVEFVQFTPGERYQSVIRVVENFFSVGDDISDGGGTIYPERTSLGDTFDPLVTHWAFVGIKNITASGAEPEKNPMLDGPAIQIKTETNSVFQEYQTKIGLYWQEFNPTSTINGARLELDESLTDLCLIEDYQEGDLRLYIDGKRIYGRHTDIPANNTNYVGAIVLDSDLVITPDTLVRIELGEYWTHDIGRKDVVVVDPTGNSPDIYNLSRYKRIEQTKTKTNQYPLFKIYDILGNPLEESNSIFWFKENGEFELNRTLDLRAEYKRNERDLVFEHGLVDSEGKLRCYLDLRDNKIKTIWKK